MQHAKCIFFLAAFAVLPFFSFGQFTVIRHLKRQPVKTINFEQGLLNNETTGVTTDLLGFTWVSTRTGLQRFNGYTLDNINPIVGNDTIHINSHVYLFALQNGSIWISYKNGVLVYNPFTNSFKKIISLPVSENPFFSIVPLLETKEGIWCMQQGKGIVIYNNSLKSSVVVNVADINDLINSDDLINNTIIAANKHYIFIRVSTNQLLQINTDSHNYKYLNNDENIIGIGCNDNNYFITTITQLSSINIVSGKLIKTLRLKNLINENLNYNCIQSEDNNELLISLNSKLFEFDSTLNYQNEFTTLNEEAVVPTGSIHHIYVDRFKRIWLLTNNDIRIIQNFDIPFKHFVYKNEKSNYIRSIYYDTSQHFLLAGCIAAGTGLSGGIQLFDTSGNTLWPKSFVIDKAKNISNIEKLTEGKYLVTTSDEQGWYLLSLPEKRFDKFNWPVDTQTKSQLNATVWPNNLQRINDSTIFIASSANIFRCIFKNVTIKSIKPILPFNGSASNVINCFIYTSEKNLWVGTNSGVIYKLQGDGSLQTMDIPGNYIIRCFAEDKANHIWIGTDKGIYVYTNSGQLIKTVNIQSGLLDDYIYAMLPTDKYNAVFASSKLGLSYVPLTGSIKNYTKELGLQENEFNTESALKTATGKFYFGGINGISAFYPSALSEVKDNPVLNITRLIVNDSLYDFSPNTWRNDSIILNYDQNHLQLDVAALGLLNTDEYEYKYRLKGFEQNWQTTHQPTGIKYFLQPGNYLFEISCTPIFSSTSVFKKTIVIIVSPPWWQTWWFKILMIIFFVSIIALVVQQYLHRQYQKKLRALQLNDEIQKERERISRDLHDNLGAYAAAIASNVATIKSSQNGNDSNILHQLKDNSQSIITQISDTIWALNKEAISLTAVSDRFKVFLQKIQPNHPNINITIEENISNDQKLSPESALHLFRIMQEAINNAVRHSEGNQINIFINAAGTWEIIIEDNGKGIVKQTINSEGGNGLINMRTRAQHAGWKILWQQNTPCGTSVIISSTTN